MDEEKERIETYKLISTSDQLSTIPETDRISPFLFLLLLFLFLYSLILLIISSEYLM